MWIPVCGSWMGFLESNQSNEGKSRITLPSLRAFFKNFIFTIEHDRGKQGSNIEPFKPESIILSFHSTIGFQNQLFRAWKNVPSHFTWYSIN